MINNVANNVFQVTRFNLANNKTFTGNRAAEAKKALDTFKFKGEQLSQIQQIAEKGYTVKDGQILSFFGSKKKKGCFIFAL